MYHSSQKICSRDHIAGRVKSWRVLGQSIVFTNGCFDLMHPGHLSYLEDAQALGDRLVLGLNTDASVSKLKGPQRPIMDQEARARLLAALQFVDAVVLFEEETPAELIRQVMPDILVKGGDYEIKEIVGYDTVVKNGGEVKTLPIIEGYSTSTIIEKIRSSS